MRAIHVALAAIILGLVGIGGYAISTHLETREITVVSKERLLSVTSSDSGTSSSYRNFVYTTDEAYVVEDNLWNWHFTSGTVYAQLREGATCQVTLSGYRNGVFSMFQNIIKADCR